MSLFSEFDPALRLKDRFLWVAHFRRNSIPQRSTLVVVVALWCLSIVALLVFIQKGERLSIAETAVQTRIDAINYECAPLGEAAISVSDYRNNCMIKRAPHDAQMLEINREALTIRRMHAICIFLISTLPVMTLLVALLLGPRHRGDAGLK
jgi:hypothetical protein